MKKYATFKDLLFRDHPTGAGKQGLLFFKNGYGISVVRFKISGRYGSYTSNESEWEVAILKGDKEGYELDYTTPITDDVIGHLTEDEVTEIIMKIQKLKQWTFQT